MASSGPEKVGYDNVVVNSNCLYELKGDLSPLILKDRFNDNLKIVEFLKICMENHASVTGWQKLFISYKCFQLSAAAAIATFEIYG